MMILRVFSNLNDSMILYVTEQFLSRIILNIVKFMPFSAEEGVAEIFCYLKQYIFARF